MIYACWYCFNSVFWYYSSFRQTHFLSHTDHLGVSLQQISKSMGFAGLVCFWYLLCELQVVLKILKSSVNWILPCRNLLRTNAMCTLSVFVCCWQILPSHMILTQIFPRCVRLHQPCGIYPVSQTAGKSKSYLLTVSMTTHRMKLK